MATKLEDIIDLSDESMKTMATSDEMLSDVAPAETMHGDDPGPISDLEREQRHEEEDTMHGERSEEIFGRMSMGMDESDFDFMQPYRRLETGAHEGAAGDELDLMSESVPGSVPVPAEEAVEGEVLNSHRKWKREQRRQEVKGYSMPDVLDPYPARMPEVLDPYSDVRDPYAILGDDEDATPDVFESPTEEQFPVLSKAIAHFKAAEVKPKVVRIDTDKTYDQFVSKKAFEEIVRRVSELRAALEEHFDKHEHEEHPGYHQERKQLRKWEEIVSGDVEALSSAKSAGEALQAMPKVPVDVAPDAEGNIRCWRDGDAVVCSIRFGTPGGVRIATMMAKPQVDVDDVARRALKAGVDPVVVLGALPELADAACAKRLVRDVAGAALQAQRRYDVCGQDDAGDEAEPVVLTSRGADEGAAPLAAIMHVQQRADAGDPQARSEIKKLKVAASTPSGQQIAAPLLAESSRRLSVGRAAKAEKPGLLHLYWGAI
jgi:hypothetical protein